MTSTYRRRPTHVPKSPNGQQYCHGCECTHPRAEFDAVWDAKCMRWPKLKRSKRAPRPQLAPARLVHPQVARWLAGRGGGA